MHSGMCTPQNKTKQTNKQAKKKQNNKKKHKFIMLEVNKGQ